MSSKGQTLLELVVVIAVVVIVVAALVFATIASIRNASFAQNQLQATKLAQEGLEKVRSLRDRDTAGSIQYPELTDGKFSDLWSVELGCQIEINNCYFYFNLGSLVNGTSVTFESIPPDNFKRQIQIEDYDGGTQHKKVIAIVVWTDFSGSHESKLTTILGRI